MVLDQAPTLAHSVDAQVTRCGYCPRPVVFLPSIFGGHALCFDAAPVLASLDAEQVGWLPRTVLINDQPRAVYAPGQAHSYKYRRRFKTVMMLHDCSGLTSAVNAA